MIPIIPKAPHIVTGWWNKTSPKIYVQTRSVIKSILATVTLIFEILM
jgi:hypothetical protein